MLYQSSGLCILGIIIGILALVFGLPSMLGGLKSGGEWDDSHDEEG